MTPVSFSPDQTAHDELPSATLTAIERELLNREEELPAVLAELRANLRPAAAQLPPVLPLDDDACLIFSLKAAGEKARQHGGHWGQR